MGSAPQKFVYPRGLCARAVNGYGIFEKDGGQDRLAAKILLQSRRLRVVILDLSGRLAKIFGIVAELHGW